MWVWVRVRVWGAWGAGVDEVGSLGAGGFRWVRVGVWGGWGWCERGWVSVGWCRVI